MHKVGLFSLIAAIIGVTLLATAALTYRGGVLELGTAFALLRAGAYTTLGALALSILVVVATFMVRQRRPLPKPRYALLALLIAGAMGIYLLGWQQALKSNPYIHDITTDTQDPPAFVAIAPLRVNAPNPAEYAGAEVAKQQREAFPEIQTLHFAASPNATFDAAVATVNEMGWNLVDSDRASGRIEASHTSRWFGFVDDVVIRVAASETSDASKVDIRSKSRVGQSDLGANAARIRAFAKALDQRLNGNTKEP